MKRCLLTLAFCLTASGCVTTPEPAATEPAATETEPEASTVTDEPAVEKTTLDDCIKACEQASMARSVAWEIVQADCRASCDGSDKPLDIEKPLELEP